MTSTTEKNNAREVKKKKTLWKFLFFLALVISITIFLIVSIRTTESSVDINTFSVRRDNLTVSVIASGSIRAHQSLKYACQVENRGLTSGITILDVVASGTQITQKDVDNGMVLVQLDSSPLEDRLITERMTLATYEDNLNSAKESYDIQVIDNQSSIVNGQLTVEFAYMDLQKYMGEELSERLVTLTDEVVEDINDVTSNKALMYIAEIMQQVKNDPNLLAGSSAGQRLKELQDNIIIAQGNLTTQEQTLIGTEKLYDANFVSARELQQDQLALKSRQFTLESSQISLDLFLDYDFPKEAKQYLSNYIEAKRNLDRIYAQCRSRLAQANSSLGSSQTRYDTQAEQVRRIEEQIEKCTIRAKAPGMVVYGSGASSDIMSYLISSRGTGRIAKGETVTEGQVLISTPDTSAWIVEVSLNETDVDKVRAGQSAVIVMDAFPEKTLIGTVTEVALLPDQQNILLNPDRKVYNTQIMLNGPYEFLRSQMSCRVEIISKRLENVLIVPIIAVANNSGQRVCWTLNSAGKPEKNIIRIGSFNDSFVQIIDGLEVGQEVMINPPLIAELTAPSTDVFDQLTTQNKINEFEFDQSDAERKRLNNEQGFEMDSEDIQQMMERFGNRGTSQQGDSNIDTEEIQKMMENIGNRGMGEREQ